MIANKLGRRNQRKEQAGGVSIFRKRSDLNVNAKCSLKDVFHFFCDKFYLYCQLSHQAFRLVTLMSWSGKKACGERGIKLSASIPFNPDSRPSFVGFRIFALFRLQNIAQCCAIFPHFFCFPPPFLRHASRLPPPLFLPPVHLPLLIALFQSQNIAQCCVIPPPHFFRFPPPYTCIPLPTPSTPASRTPPAPFSSGLPPPIPSTKQGFRDTKMT